MKQKIYKIFTPSQWENFQESGVFHGSTLDLKDGFIHLSFENQWQPIWDKFFNKAEIYLVELRNLDLQLLKIEANKPGGVEYPHYYDLHLTKDNVKDVIRISST